MVVVVVGVMVVPVARVLAPNRMMDKEHPTRTNCVYWCCRVHTG